MSFLSSCVFAARSTCWNDKHEKKHNSSKSIDTFRFLSCSVSLSSNKHRLGSLMSQWVLTGSVSFSVFEWSPFVSASRRLSASLYMYSSDLARNSDMLPKTNTNIYLNCFWRRSRQKKKKKSESLSWPRTRRSWSWYLLKQQLNLLNALTQNVLFTWRDLKARGRDRQQPLNTF